MHSPVDRIAWRLFPSEQVLWHGRKTPGVPRDRGWQIAPVLMFVLATVAVLFAGLMTIADLPGVRNAALVATYLGLGGIALLMVPHYLLDGAEYLITDRRVLWRRGKIRRSLSRDAITFARITWHRSVSGIGHLELVCAAPFGPLQRKQRLVLHDVQDPDTVLASIRGVRANPHADDPDLPLVERLDPDEEVLWMGRPEGWLIGSQEIAIALLGGGLSALGLSYGYRASTILLDLERHGLPVLSWAWMLFFLAVVLTWGLMMAIGGWLLWRGIWRSRHLGHDTEYVLTQRRLLIRRGYTELSVDRQRIVDVADTRTRRGLHNLFLMLDTPQSRALAVSGALGALPPSRDTVPPVLYELRDIEGLPELIVGSRSNPRHRPSWSDAA